MSARRIDGMMPTGLEELILFENSHLKQINREMKKNLDGLEQDVKEAKKLVQKTQSKVEELAASIGEIEKPE